MRSLTANWEDEDNNRLVEFSVGYTVENNDIELGTVTPTRVLFRCPDTNSIARSIRVHTANGRELLARQIARSGRLQTIEQEVRAAPAVAS